MAMAAAAATAAATAPLPPRTLINAAADVVPEALDGLLLSRPELAILHAEEGARMFVVVPRAAPGAGDRRTVGLVCGGGSGHEPHAVGFVGDVLDAAVAGDVFSSPHVAAIVAGLRTVAARRHGGLVVIVKQYSGDRLAFGLAAEVLRSEGVPVRVVAVADDAAVDGGPVIGRRGVAGTVLVYKVAAAVANGGGDVDAVAAAAAGASGAVASFGVSISTCTVPGGVRSSRLDGTTAIMEWGLGIHGEPGAEVVPATAPLPTANEVARRMVDSCAHHLLAKRPGSTAGGAPTTLRVAALVNSLGGLSSLEMAVLTRAIIAATASAGAAGASVRVEVHRLYVGAVMTALDMRGASLSLLDLDAPISAAAPGDALTTMAHALDATVHIAPWNAAAVRRHRVDGELGPATLITLACIEDAVVHAPAAPAAAVPAAAAPARTGAGPGSTSDADAGAGGGAGTSAGMPVGAASASGSRAAAIAAALAACAAIADSVEVLNALDTTAGDGDCGATMALVAAACTRALLALPASAPLPSSSSSSSSAAASLPAVAAAAAEVLHSMAGSVSVSAGGTSGVLYALMLQAAANAAKVSAAASATALCADLLGAAVAAVMSCGNARRGDRTLLDALGPAHDALVAAATTGTGLVPAVTAAAAAAEAGAAATKGMAARAGRSSYVSPDRLRATADPGATAAALWLRAIALQVAGSASCRLRRDALTRPLEMRARSTLARAWHPPPHKMRRAHMKPAASAAAVVRSPSAMPAMASSAATSASSR